MLNGCAVRNVVFLVLSFELSALPMLNCSMLIFVIGFAACQSMNVKC